jgi:hypothetical protein
MPSPDPVYYGTIEGADAYHLARGNTAWLPSPDDGKEAALIRASTWVDGAYGGRFPGTRTEGRDQERAWPRTGAADREGNALPDDEVPREIEHATYEAALRERVTPGSLSPDFVPASGVKSETVGPISVTYRDGITLDGYRPIATVVDDLLFGLLGGRNRGWSFAKRA